MKVTRRLRGINKPEAAHDRSEGRKELRGTWTRSPLSPSIVALLVSLGGFLYLYSLRSSYSKQPEFLRKFPEPDGESEDARFIMASGSKKETNGLCEAIGGVGRYPLFESSRATMTAAIPAFLDAYEESPAAARDGSMAFEHAFAWWFLVMQLDPHVIVESGSQEGLSTWLARKAAPDSRIISLDVRDPMRRLSNVTYYTGVDFVDFVDVRWTNELPFVDRRKVLVLFNDRQSGFRRAKEAHALGFRHVAFNHNGDFSDSQNYDLKIVCDAGDEDQWSGYTYDHDGRTSRETPWDVHVANGEYFSHIAETYFEFPPMVSASMVDEVHYDPKRAPQPLLTSGDSSERSDLHSFAGNQLGMYQNFLYVYFKSRNPRLVDRTAKQEQGPLPQGPVSPQRDTDNSTETVETEDDKN